MQILLQVGPCENNIVLLRIISFTIFIILVLNFNRKSEIEFSKAFLKQFPTKWDMIICTCSSSCLMLVFGLVQQYFSNNIIYRFKNKMKIPLVGEAPKSNWSISETGKIDTPKTWPLIFPVLVQGLPRINMTWPLIFPVLVQGLPRKNMVGLNYFYGPTLFYQLITIFCVVI